MRSFSLHIVCLLFLPLSLISQASEIPYDSRIRHIVDRLESLYFSSDTFHASIRNYDRKEVADWALERYKDVPLSILDLEDMRIIFKDNTEWIARGATDSLLLHSLYKIRKRGFLKHFYKTPANFLEFESPDFFIKINPILNLKYGGAGNNEDPLFQNTRGIAIRGEIDNKIYFYTSLFENQRRFNDYIEDRIDQFQAIPGQGFYKDFQSRLFDSIKGWDYFNTQAYVGFNISKSVGLELGHGKNFIGNGYRSLLLSDLGHNYFYLKFNTQFWKLRYQNIFAELSALGHADVPGEVLLPKKYMAAHYLSFNFSSKFSIGIFEAIVFGRQDHFEFQYLNPVIFYRSIEGMLNSPDNVLIGLNSAWNIRAGIQLYGQLMIDEFKVDQISEGSGWWGNKYGAQIGLKYFNILGIDHLDGRIEYNLVRPYTYAHRDTLEGFSNRALASFSHYNQPLAHPLGSNFKEWVLHLRYQPTKRMVFSGRFIRTRYGDDFTDQNWGGNILIPFTTRVQDYNNALAQGDERKIQIFGLDLTYEIYHNYFIELQLLFRDQKQAQVSKNRNTNYWGIGMRVNMSNQTLDY